MFISFWFISELPIGFVGQGLLDLNYTPKKKG
jgi:hypothetical protein